MNNCFDGMGAMMWVWDTCWYCIACSLDFMDYTKGQKVIANQQKELMKRIAFRI